MSEFNQKASLRQLPPGKLNNIKKIFEDGENSSSKMGDKHLSPARPPPPQNRPKSPVRHQPVWQQPQTKLPTIQQQQASTALHTPQHILHPKDQDVQSGQQSYDTEKVRSFSNASDHAQQVRDAKQKISSVIAGRLVVSLDSAVPSQAGCKGIERSTSFNQPPKPALRHSRERSSGDELIWGDNSLQSGITEKTNVNTNISDLYAKVIKPKKESELSPRRVSFNPEDKTECSIPRREAIKKNDVEKRKTVTGLETEIDKSENLSVNVAKRTQFFDGSKSDKPTLPLKPEAVKRQASMRTSKEFDEQQQNVSQTVSKNNNESERDGLYHSPWEGSKNFVLEMLKKTQPSPALLTPPSTKPNSSSGEVKTVAPPKPPALGATFKKLDPTSHISPVTKDNEFTALKNQLKSTQSECPSESSPQRKFAPPPKPPRTHAHDVYLEVKAPISENFDGKPAKNAASQVAVRKTVHIMDTSGMESTQEETKHLSVKDRISKMEQVDTTSSEPLPLPSVSFSNKNAEQNIAMRNNAPSRPPPPKRRPNSEDSQTFPSSLLHTDHSGLDDNGPIIIPVSPRSKQLLEADFSDLKRLRYRRPSDKLPPEPDSTKQLQRFPLRKSYSSECLHSSRSSSLNGELEDEYGLNMSQSSYGSQYEAVIDPDGYAVPNVFLRLPGTKRLSIKDDNLDILSPKEFLTRINGSAGEDSSAKTENIQGNKVAATHEQSLGKVNKKKMFMVKQKINQAYADVDIAGGQLSETSDSDFYIVNHENDVSDSVTEPMVLKKRIDYCTSVRLKSSKSIRHCKEYLSAIYPQLFEYCLIVGLQPLVDADGYQPYVMHKFPENVSSNLSVPNFCFPDATIFKPGSVTSASESYSFVMTYADGSRVYGYCRRLQPLDSSLPEVICIISPIDAFNMYNTLLNEIEARRRITFDMASELIAAAFGRPLPKPGKVCHIRTLDINGEMETIFLNRSSDNRLENVNYESPLHYLGTDRLVKVFSSMLMERRIILCSSNLSVLTQTVHALSALLYPFQWQHVYIPLLPHEMLDVLCAPVPYIVGVLTAFLPKVLKLDLDEVFIVDLDKKNIVKGQGDESTILPKMVQKALKTAINMCKIDAEARNAQWLMVAEAFLRMFIEMVGHFNNHICAQQDGNRIFQKEGFVHEVVSKEVREFLSWFIETQMFDVFIMNHVDKSDNGTSDLFMQRLAECKESKEESSRRKGLGAKVKNFGKALKTKLQAS